MTDEELLDYLKKQVGEQPTSQKIMVLYGSETGNAEYVSGTIVQDLKRRGLRAKAIAMDDYDFEELPEEKDVIFVVATCGQVHRNAGSQNDVWSIV